MVRSVVIGGAEIHLELLVGSCAEETAGVSALLEVVFISVLEETSLTFS